LAKKSDSDVTRLRGQIDEIDLAILQLIAKRRDIALEIAKTKQKSGLQDDEERMRQVLERIQKRSKELSLDEAEMKAVWKVMIAYIIREQMEKYPY